MVCSLKVLSRYIHIRPLAIVITLAVIGVLCKLGFWQLSRADEKRIIQSTYAVASKTPITSISKLHELWSQKKALSNQVELTGKLNSKTYWLLDNAVYKGKVGYDVVTLLAHEDYVVLVNLGWVQAPVSRAELPKVNIPTDPIVVRGLTKSITDKPFRLKEVARETSWPKRVQILDVDALTQDIGQALMPIVVYADNLKEQGFEYHYKVINMGPEKHHAYAVQWFSLAFAAGIIFIFANWKRHE